MIKSFGDDWTYELFMDDSVPPQGCGWAHIAHVAKRKLKMLDASTELTDLWSPPSNRLKSLQGNLHSIRVNDQWRIVFEWHDGDAHNVEIIDYHD